MGIESPLNVAVLAGSIPVVVLLFRVLGPRRAILLAVVGGYAFLARVKLVTPLPVSIQISKPAIIGAGVALGILCFDWRALVRARPHWLDLPMLVFAASPMLGLLQPGRPAPWDVADAMVQAGLIWLVPYVAGRLYFADREGARSIGVAVVVAALLLVPVCLFETVMGPKWYLAGLIHGLPYQEGMVDRLGGWRPEGFFNDGIELANWMALGAVTAFWLWLGRSWRPRWGPSWGPALVLVLTSLACRGLYGYLTLGLGLAAALLTWGFRTRWALVALMLVAPAYITTRVSGLWDARTLADLTAFTGRSGSVAARLWSEGEVLTRVLPDHLVLGFGYHIRHAAEIGWPDGYWLVLLWEGGMVGLALHFLALHLIPAGLALSRPPGRPARWEACNPAWGLALFTILHMIGSIHTQFYIPPTALIAGALVGGALGRPMTRAGRTEHDTYRPAPDPSSIPIVAGLACLLYVFGHGPVAGHDEVKLIGGLGAALLFAGAGGVGAWASEQLPLSRLALFCVTFAALGVSFNLALHPSTRPWATADLLQGLALGTLIVACWHRAFGASAGSDAVLAALPLVAHFLLRPHLRPFPGLQYLIAAPADARSLFPACPWLTLSALGAWATRARPSGNLAASALFALLTLFAWWTDPGQEGPIKFPMDLSYAMLSCTSVGLAFSIAQVLKGRGPADRFLRWLGRRWLVFFYVHFAIVYALRYAPGLPPWAVWSILAAGSVAGTWLVSKALAPIGRWLQAPASWGLLLAPIVVAALAPGLPPLAVAGLAGLTGLVFADHYELLAFSLMNARRAGPSPDPPRAAMSSTFRAEHESEEDEPAGNSFGRNLVRLAVVLTLLATPELLDAAMRAWQERSPTTRPRPAPPSSPRIWPVSRDGAGNRNRP